MKTRFLPFTTLFLIMVSARAEPVPIIFDTDITGDVDDVLALAMIHSLADRNACELLAVTISKENELAAPFTDAVNTFYGRPNIPIGINPKAPHRDSKYLGLVNEKDGGKYRYPHDIGISKDPENAIALLRKTLSSTKDHSVTIIQVGLATNLAELLQTKGDEYSPLNGPDLIRSKVKLLSVMAGAFETINFSNHYLEANVRNHVSSMQQLADEWPNDVPVVWSGFKIGITVPYPRESIAQDFDYRPHHIVKESYLLHSGPNHDRPTWDLTSVLYAVYPDRGYFNLSTSGRVTVEDDGFTRFEPGRRTRSLSSPNMTTVKPAMKRDQYLIMTDAQAARVTEALVHMVAQPPSR